MNLGRSLLPVALFAVLAGCGSGADTADKLAPEKSGKAQPTNDPVVAADGEVLGTPMAERIGKAVSQSVLNWRNRLFDFSCVRWSVS